MIIDIHTHIGDLGIPLGATRSPRRTCLLASTTRGSTVRLSSLLLHPRVPGFLICLRRSWM